MTRIVFNAIRRSGLAQHLDVVSRTHAQALCLEQLVFTLEFLEAFGKLGFDVLDGTLKPLGAGDVVGGGEDVHLLFLADHFAGHGVQGVERVDLVTEKFNADRELFVHGDDLDGIAAHTERPAHKRDVVAVVLHVDELAKESISLDLLADA